MIKLIINDKDKDLKTLTEVDNAILSIANLKSAEIWLEGYNEKKLCILLNETRAFFMYLDEEESSYMVYDESESEDDYEDFLLSNGQLDEYPKAMTVDRNNINDAIKHYYNTGQRFKDMNWIEG
jgi:hypothetical protein